MSREEFKNKVKSHDWYYMFSDDHSVWSKGDRAHKALSAQHQALECPFSLAELRMYSGEMILENFELKERGYFRIGNKYSCVAPAKREDLITLERADEITAWFKGDA